MSTFVLIALVVLIPLTIWSWWDDHHQSTGVDITSRSYNLDE